MKVASRKISNPIKIRMSLTKYVNNLPKMKAAKRHSCSLKKIKKGINKRVNDQKDSLIKNKRKRCT